MTELERRCVLPFYLKMMRLNALGHDVPLGTVRKVGRQTADSEVAALLASGWRPRVMGAPPYSNGWTPRRPRSPSMPGTARP